MAVTKKSYTVLAPWTVDEVADQFRYAFQDGGLMADWEDSFTVSYGEIPHYFRVLKVVYDESKAYGQMHYVFAFVPEGSTVVSSPAHGIYVSLATFWDSENHVPLGEHQADYVMPTTFQTTFAASDNNSAGNSQKWRRIFFFNQSSTITIYRYTSEIDPGFTWFLIKSGITEANFHIVPGHIPLAPWINLDEVCYHGFLSAIPKTESYTVGTICFRNYGSMKRSFYGGGICGFETTSVNNYGGLMRNYNETHVFAAVGNEYNYSYNEDNFRNGVYLWLPVAFARNNSAVVADRTPVFTGLPLSFYLQSNPPPDFGIAFHYENNTMETQDIFQVTPGVEEWEIIALENHTLRGIGEGASPLFLAKVIGPSLI